MDAVIEQLAYEIFNGYSVKIDGLGTFSAKLGVRKDKEMDSFDDGNQHLTEFGDTFSGSPFSSLSNTSRCTNYIAPRGEDEQEKYEYTDYSYPISSSRTSVVSIYLWEEDD